MQISENRPLFDQALERLAEELGKLRTGRANPSLIEDIKADYYGTPTPLKQMANISVPEARQLLLQPWDKNALQPIEKAIRDSGLGLNPTNEGDKLRITIPALNEERRKELIKVAGKLAEEARIKVRSIREDVVKEIKAGEEKGDISEDARFRMQDELQKVVDDYNTKIKDILAVKEKEMMTV